MKPILCCFFVVFWLTSCSDSDEKNNANNIYIPDALPEMKVAEKKSWGGDVVLSIYRTEQRSQHATAYTILSEYHNKPVGFYLLVTQPAAGGAEGKAVFTSMGDTSNNFLKILADIYKIKRDTLVFADSVTANYILLGDALKGTSPGNYSTAAQAKLFFGDSTEIYLNIYENHNSISLPEKDSVYRRAVIQAFSKR